MRGGARAPLAPPVSAPDNCDNVTSVPYLNDFMQRRFRL